MGLATAIGRLSSCSGASSPQTLQQEGKGGSRKLFPYPSTPPTPILLSPPNKRPGSSPGLGFHRSPPRLRPTRGDRGGGAARGLGEGSLASELCGWVRREDG